MKELLDAEGNSMNAFVKTAEELRDEDVFYQILAVLKEIRDK